MWKSIKLFFGRVFGSENAAKDTLAMIRDAGDALILTEEEKVQYNQEGLKLYLEYLKITRDGGHIARRVIGIMVVAVWVWLVFSVGLAYGLTAFFPGLTEAANAMYALLTSATVTQGFLAVTGFYFGAGFLTRWSNNKTNSNE